MRVCALMYACVCTNVCVCVHYLSRAGGYPISVYIWQSEGSRFGSKPKRKGQQGGQGGHKNQPWFRDYGHKPGGTNEGLGSQLSNEPRTKQNPNPKDAKIFYLAVAH